jgi:hypothetical protein
MMMRSTRRGSEVRGEFGSELKEVEERFKFELEGLDEGGVPGDGGGGRG